MIFFLVMGECASSIEVEREIKIAINEMKDNPIRALEHWETLVEKEQDIQDEELKKRVFNEAIKAAKGAMKRKDTVISALYLWQELVRKGQGFDGAKKSAAEAMSNVDAVSYALDLWGELVQKGQGFNDAIKAATDAMNVKGSVVNALSVWEELFKKGQGFDEAIESAKDLMSNVDTVNYALDLWVKLVEKGQGFNEAIKAATNAITREDIGYSSVYLWMRLFKNEQRIQDKKLKTMMFKKATKVASDAMDNKKTAWKAEILWETLFRRGKGISEGLISSHGDIRRLAQEILETEIKKRLQEEHIKKTKLMGLVLFIDQGVEGIRDNKIGTMTQDLSDFFKNKGKHILLVTSSLLYNFVYRRVHEHDSNHTENRNLKNVDISKNDWKLFAFSNNPLILIIPKDKFKKWENYFKFDENSFEDISNKLDNYDELAKHLKSLAKPKLSTEHLRAIFYSNDDIIEKRIELPTWVILLSGHGSFGGYIADIPIENFSYFLDFFNWHIRTKMLLIESCYAGGMNVDYIRFYNKNKKILRSLNYTLGITGVSDDVTYSGAIEVSRYLDKAVQGYLLEEVLKDVYRPKIFPNAIHAQTNFPQILYPRGFEFFPASVSDHVKSIGWILLRKYRKERRDIDLGSLKRKRLDPSKDPHVVLIYPLNVDQRIKVRPLSLHVLRKEGKFPFLKHNYLSAKKKQWDEYPVFHELFSKLNLTSQGQFRSKENSFFQDFKKLDDYFNNIDEYKQLLFPALIPMNKGDVVAQSFYVIHVINKVDLKGDGKLSSQNLTMLPYVGVLNFIRDAFFDISDDQRTLKIFKIKELKGANDISLLLTALRYEKGINQKSPLEKALIGFENDEIILKDVYVEAGFHDSMLELKRELTKILKKNINKEITQEIFRTERISERGKIGKILQKYVGEKLTFANYRKEKERLIIRKLKFSFEDKFGSLKTWETVGAGWNFVEAQTFEQVTDDIEKVHKLMKKSERWAHDEAIKIWKRVCKRRFKEALEVERVVNDEFYDKENVVDLIKKTIGIDEEIVINEEILYDVAKVLRIDKEIKIDAEVIDKVKKVFGVVGKIIIDEDMVNKIKNAFGVEREIRIDREVISEVKKALGIDSDLTFWENIKRYAWNEKAEIAWDRTEDKEAAKLLKKLAEDMIEIDRTEVEFWKKRVEGGKNFDIAIEIAKKLMKNEYTFYRGIRLWRALFEKGKGFDEAVKAAMEVTKKRFMYSSDLWKALLEKGQGIEEGLKSDNEVVKEFARKARKKFPVKVRPLPKKLSPLASEVSSLQKSLEGLGGQLKSLSDGLESVKNVLGVG